MTISMPPVAPQVQFGAGRVSKSQPSVQFGGDFSQKLKLGLAGLGLVGGLATATSGTKVVDSGYAGVSKTLGEIDSKPVPPGFHFKLPFITTIDEMLVKQRTVEAKAEAASQDLQTLTIKYKVLYDIPQNMAPYLASNYEGDPFRSLIEPRVREILKEETSKYPAGDVIKKRTEVKAQTLDRVRAALTIASKDAQGNPVKIPLININDITIDDVELSPELVQAIEAKQVAEQKAQQKEYELASAVKDAEIVKVRAKGEADAISIRGDALRNNPGVINLNLIEKWDGKAPLVTTGGNGGNFILPLDQIKK